MLTVSHIWSEMNNFLSIQYSREIKEDSLGRWNRQGIVGMTKLWKSWECVELDSLRFPTNICLCRVPMQEINEICLIKVVALKTCHCLFSLERNKSCIEYLNERIVPATDRSKSCLNQRTFWNWPRSRVLTGRYYRETGGNKWNTARQWNVNHQKKILRSSDEENMSVIDL